MRERDEVRGEGENDGDGTDAVASEAAAGQPLHFLK